MDPTDPQGMPAPDPGVTVARGATDTAPILVPPAAGEVPPPPIPGEAPAEPVTSLPGPAGGMPPPPKRSRTRMLLIGAGILVVAGVAIGAVAASSGGKKAAQAVSSAPSTSPSPSPSVVVAPPVGFAAKGQTSPFGVRLSWSAPVGEAVQGYRLYREGVQIAAVPSETTDYLDSNVSPGKTYTYEILTRGEGLFQSAKVSTDVMVPVPSLASARVDGTFEVKFKTTSQSGYVGSLGTFTLGWDFTPKCREGACNVTIKDVSIKDLKTTLTRKGATYSGSDAAKFIGGCGGVTDTSNLTVDLRVKKARIIEGEWRATKLVGTVVESHPALRGCTSGGAHFSVTANWTV
jgi:hypothetical protein